MDHDGACLKSVRDGDDEQSRLPDVRGFQDIGPSRISYDAFDAERAELFDALIVVLDDDQQRAPLLTRAYDLAVQAVATGANDARRRWAGVGASAI